VAVELANQAAREGHEVAVVAATAADPRLLADLLDPAVDYRTITPAGTAKAAWYRAGSVWLWRERAWLGSRDVVHCHLTFAAYLGTLIGAARRARGTRYPRVVETIHAVGMPIPAAQRRRIRFFAAGRDGVALMAADPYWRAFAADRPALPVHFIANGIALPQPAAPDARAAARAALGIPPEALVVGTIGRMVAERMPLALLEAFAAVPGQDGGPHLVMGGAGPLVEPVRREAAARGLAHRVHCPGLIEYPVRLLAALDLYLSVNVGAVTGIAGLEAAAAGLPVIAVQTIPGRAAGGDDWIWSDPAPSEVGARIAALLADPEARTALGERQRAHVVERHSAAAMHRAYCALYSAAGAQASAERE